MADAVKYPECPHCGGQHWGQRFDDCPYVDLLTDPNATEEQKMNAAGILAGNTQLKRHSWQEPPGDGPEGDH